MIFSAVPCTFLLAQVLREQVRGASTNATRQAINNYLEQFPDINESNYNEIVGPLASLASNHWPDWAGASLTLNNNAQDLQHERLRARLARIARIRYQNFTAGLPRAFQDAASVENDLQNRSTFGRAINPWMATLAPESPIPNLLPAR